MKRRLLLQIKSSELSSLDSFQKRLHDIKTDSTDESSFGDFRSRLREAAKCAHEAIQAGVGTSQVQEEKE